MNTGRIIITIIITLTVNSIFAQSKSKFNAETQGGYEYNYFRSPKEIRTDNDVILTDNDLIASSFYQDVELNYKYQYKWDKNRIRFSANPFSRIFYESFDDSYWSLNVKANYDYKITKKTLVFAEARFLRMNREGLGGEQDVLINPLGYTNYGATAGLEFEPFSNNELSVEGFYNFRNFDAFGVRDLQFNEFGAQLSSVQTFKINRLKHKLGAVVYVKKRLYDTFNASDVDGPNGERDWDYAKGTFFYQLPFSKQLEIKPSFSYYVRIDNSTNRSGFSQYGPGIAMKYNNDKTKIRTTFSFITRNYEEIEARDTEDLIGEKLKYEYANFQLNASQKIGGGFSVTATISSRIRSTNYTDIDARSFRNYRNQYAGVGVLWEF
ncbi:hypothetical protein [Aquimarina sp. MMG016]|uniref:hypothetical protein n=1 Tax=Aquimarina sp. MMG016 TaxID=2822690 RepID=UPI001B3A3155|nr:hypothetical protein [Aquimarina sp. MMG016]MBQ4822135.1 hypothetical protein [Aquimarina sp. MMG016]